MFESLENRTLLSAGHGAGKGGGFDPGAYGAAQPSLNETTGVLTINNAHDVQINPVYAVNADGTLGDALPGRVELVDKSQPDGSAGYFTYFSGVNRIVVQGTKDYDIISANVDGGMSADVYGNGGADALTVTNNSTGVVNVYGGAGNDSIFASAASAGTTTVYGGLGKDSFSSGLNVPLDPDVTWIA